MTENAERPKVLVVDDEPQILDSIRSLLEDDFNVLVSTDATQAIDILKDAQIAVILADQRMPKLNGHQFLAKAREICDATRILITGYVDIDALIRAVNDGQIHSYVPKPWEPTNLKVTVLKAARDAKEVTIRKKAAEIVAEQQMALARSEAAYRQQTKILRSVLDNMSDGVLVADESGKLLLLNPAAERLVGLGSMEGPQSGRSEHYGIYRPGTTDLYPADELPLARTIRGEIADGIELYIRNAAIPQGTYVNVSARPLKDDHGKIKGGVAVVRDVTQARSAEEMLRHAKEEAERANRAKSEFLSRMSHELRTPLNSILGFAQLLAMANLGAQHQSGVEQILKGGYHLLELINEVLDLARVESGRLSLSPEPVQVHDVVKEALDLVRPIAGSRDVTLNSDLSACGDLYVHADRQRLKQVLLNLLSNAMKFNRESGLVLLRCEQMAGHRLRIEVADTGPGIPEEALKKLFTPFERLDADRSAVGGTGLGLALSQRMIEAMGGTIGVESKVGVGSRFYLELPLAEHVQVGKPLTDFSASLGALNRAASCCGTILYIEDNSSNVQLVEQILALHPGVRMLDAIQGKIGIDLAKTHTPDWILLDLHLPDMKGEEVLRTLGQDPSTRNIPVTILSADATPAQIERLKATGARDYLTKPLDVKQFVLLLESTLPRVSPEGTIAAETERPKAAFWHPAPRVTVRGLPPDLVEQLRGAVRNGEKDRLDDLIAAAARQDLRTARALQELADRYEYDALTTLLAEAVR